MTLSDLANLVESYRMSQGISKEEFCKLLGLHFHTYNSFLKQEKRSQARTVCAILNYLKFNKVEVPPLNLQF